MLPGAVYGKLTRTDGSTNSSEEKTKTHYFFTKVKILNGYVRSHIFSVIREEKMIFQIGDIEKQAK